MEYTAQFYAPERGDLILNPLDARSPSWSPGDEVRHDAEALTLAISLFPDRHNENPFFVEGPRRIFAHLLTFRPSAEDLAGWLCHNDALDRLVQGTPYAAIIDRRAPAQRGGVLASLSMVADTLKLLPSEAETRGRWSAATWAQTCRGWLFLNQYAGDPDAAGPVDEPLAGHAGVAADEPRATEPTLGVVHPR